MSRYELIRPVRQSRMSRLLDTVRSYTLGPLKTSDPEIRKYFQSGDTATGLSVSEYTALNYSAVWSAVNLIAGDVSSLPLVLYRKRGKNTERYESHPLYRMLHDAPNPEMTSLTMRKTMQAHALTWGNAYAEIERDAGGRPRAIWPLTPDRVTPDRNGAGSLVYRVANPSGKEAVIDAADMLHIPGLGWDGMQGYGVIAKARESVALGIAAERFGGSFYGNGQTMGGYIQHPAKFSTPQARLNFEQSLANRHKGVQRAHGVLLLEEGMTYTQLGIPPDQAQFLESRQFQVTEIARWFNVPPHKIGDLSRSTFSNIEQQNIEYFQTTLIHWLETWEQEAMRKLISPLERNQQYIEHVEGLLRGDSEGRAKLQTAEFGIGGLMPNEVRAMSNRDPVEGGDRVFVPMNYMPLDRVDQYIDAQIESMKPVPPAPSDDARVAVLEAELRGEQELVTATRAEVETVKGYQRETADALAVAVTGLEDARRELVTERGAHWAAEDAVETLTEHAKIQASALKDAEERLEIAAARVTALTGERDAALDDLRHLHTVGEADLADVRAVTLTETKRADAATAKADTAEAAMVAMTETLAVRSQEMADLVKTFRELVDLADARTIEAMAAAVDAATRAERAEADRAIAEQAQRVANEALETRRALYADRLTQAITAQRAVVVDTVGRMVRRETEKARRHQATAPKLLAWAQSFYSLHADTYVEALTPALRVHLALVGSAADPAALAAELVTAHVAESQAQIRAVVDSEPDELHATLERVLMKWEQDRPAAVADRLLAEGVAYVRSV